MYRIYKQLKILLWRASKKPPTFRIDVPKSGGGGLSTPFRQLGEKVFFSQSISLWSVLRPKKALLSFFFFLNKRQEEISQVKMFNPNFKKKTSHTTWTLCIKFKLYAFITYIKSSCSMTFFYKFVLNNFTWEIYSCLLHITSIKNKIFYNWNV